MEIIAVSPQQFNNIFAVTISHFSLFNNLDSTSGFCTIRMVEVCSAAFRPAGVRWYYHSFILWKATLPVYFNPVDSAATKYILSNTCETLLI